VRLGLEEVLEIVEAPGCLGGGRAAYDGLVTLILHITTAAAWDEALATGWYTAPSLDTEGFIHASAPEQVVGVAEARYRGVADLVLLCVATERLKAELRYEDATDGAGVFPHVYGTINLDAVGAVVAFPERADGFALPQGLPAQPQ
jgi:uncharacterized protein (DUF952 family)